MTRRSLLVAVAVLLAGCGGGLLPGQQVRSTPSAPEKTTIRVGVVAINDFIQLPLALASQLGYFSSSGVTVVVNDYPNGVAALNALGQGEVDLLSIPYEFTIRSQLAGTRLEMIVLYDLRPGYVFSIGAQHASTVHSMKDLVGRPVCVTALATASEAFIRWLAVRDGVDPGLIPLQACGIAPEKYSAYLASGQVWAAQQVDPPFSRLERLGTASALYDTRSEQGARQLYGGAGIHPTNGLIAAPEFVRQYPKTTAVLVGAILRALHYLHSHTADQTAAQMPASYKEGDPALYAASLQKNLAIFSTDGIMPADGPMAVYKTLRLVLPALSATQVNLTQTYDNRFALAADGAP